MKTVLDQLQIGPENAGSFNGRWLEPGQPEWLSSLSPIDERTIARVALTTEAEYEAVSSAARETFLSWREVPAPKRGEVIREIGNTLRHKKHQLAQLITLETGKILSEAEGEVQEAIDIADFAVGLSRQLYGLSMHSERPSHRMYEQWHPLGVVGVITAFNFPLAVWAWNAFIAAVCGDVVIWKPSEQTPLVALAATRICETVTKRHSRPGVFCLVNGPASMSRKLAADSTIPLISATGSTGMGKEISQIVTQRLGRSILELGGNNAVIVLGDADLDLAARSVFFGAAGTAGQRCTTIRRVLVEKEVEGAFTEKLIAFYRQARIDNPLEPSTLIGPLINRRAVENFSAALDRAVSEGGRILYGGRQLTGYPSSLYVEPAIVLARKDMPITMCETFGPIVYLIPVSSLEEAISVNNNVPQGLSSAIFTDSLRAAEQFLSARGSDCGIANVNIGTSGAEIGGAFGGEKETGGGREAGSDAWKSYMRRQTTTINWGQALHLAQGVRFSSSV